MLSEASAAASELGYLRTLARNQSVFTCENRATPKVRSYSFTFPQNAVNTACRSARSGAARQRV